MEGLTNFATLVADGEDLEVEPESFDAAISRVGMIYFPDQQQALANIMRALRPGGRFRNHRLFDAGQERLLLEAQSRSSANAPSCRRRRQASPDRSA